MEANVSRILIETFVRKALRGIREDTGRITRNLIDMALETCKGRFQKSFFRTAQKMMKNENSPYYDLLRNVVRNVDDERLLTFGMNLGFNSCTLGAKKIRQMEAEGNFNIPWMISLQLDSTISDKGQDEYNKMISDGETLGICTWALFARDCAGEVMSLAFDHSQSAFFLFCTPEDLTDTLLEQATESSNVMLVVRYGEGIDEACSMLRRRRLLYSIYDEYDDSDLAAIVSGRWLEEAEALQPVFSCLLARKDCPAAAREAVTAYTDNVRNEQMYQTLPVEFASVCRYVDGIISDDDCAAGFDACGQLYTAHGMTEDPNCNMRMNTLEDILKNAFPKLETGEVQCEN